MGKLNGLTVALALLFLNQPVWAQEMDAQEVTTEPGEEREARPVGNRDIISAHSTPQSLAFLGENCLREGNIDQAINLLKESLSMDNDNADAHVWYAEALEKKLRKQDEKDPELFNKCVREWLLVMRNEVGEEKGLGLGGITPPAIGTFYRDEDHNILAKSHLIKLTGTAPRGWERNNDFLRRVLKKPQTEVTAKVVKVKDSKIKKDQYDYEEDPIAMRTPAQKKRDEKVVQQREADLDMAK
jgi:tetratricopeptide (TPR) repeat protein